MARERLKPVDAAAAWRKFATRGELAEALAKDVAAALGRAVARRGTGLLAVSGGTTPAAFLRALSDQAVDWKKIVVTLIDERFVPETSPRSNAALVESTLLQNRAKDAGFAGLYRPAAAVEDAAREAAKALAGLPWPLDVAILGMGTDAHTASFFPDAANLDALLAPKQPAYVLPVHAASAGEPRLTLPLSRIVAADFIAVHIEGPEKKAVLDAALEPEADRPISAVFRYGRKPVEIYWAP